VFDEQHTNMCSTCRLLAQKKKIDKTTVPYIGQLVFQSFHDWFKLYLKSKRIVCEYVNDNKFAINLKTIRIELKTLNSIEKTAFSWVRSLTLKFKLYDMRQNSDENIQRR